MIDIKPLTTYVCDCCGERFMNDSGNVGYIDQDIWSDAEDYGWHEIDGKHYCPNCCEFDEDNDDWVPKGGKHD